MRAVFFLRALSVALSLILSGCTAIDGFSPRSVGFNRQAAESKSETILLNILRAAYGQPLQFTDVGSISGQGNASVTAGSTLPIAVIPSGVPRTFSITPGATVSGNSTFNVANLNTQEFYYGLQSPLSMQHLALFLKSGFNNNPYVLLSLAILEMEIRSKGEKRIIQNRGDESHTFFGFYSALNFLLRAGLTVEEVKGAPQPIGPILTATEAKSPKLLAAIVAAGSEAPTLKETKRKKAAPTYQLVKKGSGSYRFCWDEASLRKFIPPVPSAVRREGDRSFVPLVLAIGGGIPIDGYTIEIGADYLCGQTPKKPPSAGVQEVAHNFSISIRSVEGIFHYLGEIVRTELGLSGQAPTPLSIPGRKEFKIFSLEQRMASGVEPSAFYDGTNYAISVDPAGYNASSRVLQLLTDLLALQSSAKTLPAPSVISVISQ